jgi:hypothetical protein
MGAYREVEDRWNRLTPAQMQYMNACGYPWFRHSWADISPKVSLALGAISLSLTKAGVWVIHLGPLGEAWAHCWAPPLGRYPASEVPDEAV